MRDAPPADERPTRVLVAVEVRLFREAIAQTLAREDDLRLIGEAASAGELTALTTARRPDVAVVDAGLPEILGALRGLDAGTSTRVLALGLPRDEHEVVAVAEVGVAGFLGPECGLADIAPAIRMTMNGEAPCSGRIAATLLKRVAAAAQPADDPGLDELTAREREILELVNAGLSNKQIARELVIGLSTVKSHVHTILRKLDVEHRSAAAARLRRVSA